MSSPPVEIGLKLSDIARLAGVSVTTASYVINGKAAQRRISAATVERVLAVVEEHGYQPDQQAAGLRRGQTRTLGFILPDLENPSYARLAKQLEQGARARGYQLLIACSDDEPETERQVVNLFRARRCDALIVASCLPAGDDTHARLVAEGLPVVAIDRQLDPQRFASVISDDQDAARRLTETLLQPAPRHIAPARRAGGPDHQPRPRRRLPPGAEGLPRRGHRRACRGVQPRVRTPPDGAIARAPGLPARRPGDHCLCTPRRRLRCVPGARRRLARRLAGGDLRRHPVARLRAAEGQLDLPAARADRRQRPRTGAPRGRGERLPAGPARRPRQLKLRD